MILFIPHILLAPPTAAAAPSTGTFFPSQLNLSAPTSAAADVLGVNASSVKSPTNLQSTALSLINSFGPNGTLQNGFAYSIQTGTLLNELNNTLLNIGNDANSQFGHGSGNLLTQPVRFIRATNIAIAAVKGTGSDTSARAAGSLSIPLIDRTDWRYDDAALKSWRDQADVILRDLPGEVDLSNTVGNAHQRPLQQIPSWIKGLTDLQKYTTGTNTTDLQTLVTRLTGDQTTLTKAGVTADQEAQAITNTGALTAWNDALLAMVPFDSKKLGSMLDTSLTNIEGKVAKAFNDSHWNALKADISLAYTWFTPDDSTNGLKGLGRYAYGTFSGPINLSSKDRLGYTLYGSVASNDLTYVSKSNTWTQGDSASIGGRLQGGSSTSHLFVEFLEKTLRPSTGGHTTSSEFQLGTEFQVNGSQWLQVAVGPSSGGLFSKVLFGLNFSFNTSGTAALDQTGTAVKTTSTPAAGAAAPAGGGAGQ